MNFSCFEGTESTGKIEVSAAASLSDVLTAISSQFTEETGLQVEITFASSSVCARQIKEGKNSSVFLSANTKWMDYLNGLYIENTNEVLLENSLVVIVPADSLLEIPSPHFLSDVYNGRIAMGDPTHVPAGLYGKKLLGDLRLWDSVKQRVIGAMDVRAAMVLVETGSVDCGIVYKTDALFSDKVKIVLELPESEEKIQYMISRFDENETTLYFYEFLFSDYSRSVFERFGFSPMVRG